MPNLSIDWLSQARPCETAIDVPAEESLFARGLRGVRLLISEVRRKHYTAIVPKGSSDLLLGACIMVR